MEEPDIGVPDVLEPGDVISVRILGSSQTEPTTTALDRAGRVHLPLLGDVKVGGLPLDQAEETVSKAAKRYDRFGQAAISLVEAKGRYVTVSGAVEKPGLLPLQGDLHFADVLAAAGGPRTTVEEAKLQNLGSIDGIRIVRNGASLPIDPRKALEGDPRHNVRIRPRDLVLVPPSLAGRIVVLGHVQRPRTMTYREGMRLTEVLADAGGLIKSSDSDDVRVIRGGYQQPRIYVASLRDLLAGRRRDVTLAPGDVIYVGEHWLSSVGEVLEKIIPAATTTALVATVAAK